MPWQAPDAHVSELYKDYISLLRRCIAISDGNPHDLHDSLIYYTGLRDELQKVVARLRRAELTMAPIHLQQDLRAQAILEVDALFLRFQAFCTDIEVAYIRLRREMLA